MLGGGSRGRGLINLYVVSTACEIGCSFSAGCSLGEMCRKNIVAPRRGIGVRVGFGFWSGSSAGDIRMARRVLFRRVHIADTCRLCTCRGQTGAPPHPPSLQLRRPLLVCDGRDGKHSVLTVPAYWLSASRDRLLADWFLGIVVKGFSGYVGLASVSRARRMVCFPKTCYRV